MTSRVRTIDVGLFEEISGDGSIHVQDGSNSFVVRGDGRYGLIRVSEHAPANNPDECPEDPGWTRYEVRAGTQRGSLEGLQALVFSEEDAFRPGFTIDEYERWVDTDWGPGVTALPGYMAAFFLRGVAGERAGKHASIGWFTDTESRERLLVALTDQYSPDLAHYRRLIDRAFSKYLDPKNRRFLRLSVTTA